jgi:hypothetical protein
MNRRMEMNDTIKRLWPELEWIKDESLRKRQQRHGRQLLKKVY